MTNARVMQVATSLNSALANYDNISVTAEKYYNKTEIDDNFKYKVLYSGTSFVSKIMLSQSFRDFDFILFNGYRGDTLAITGIFYCAGLSNGDIIGGFNDSKYCLYTVINNTELQYNNRSSGEYITKVVGVKLG